MRRSWSAALILGASIALAAPGASLAGEAVDPEIGDTWLGTVDGVRYAQDTATYASNGYADATSGCGPTVFRLVGGGGRAGDPGGAWLTAASYRGYPAAVPYDDGFEQAAYGPEGGTLTSYAICLRDVETKVVHVSPPSQPNGRSSGSVSCGAKRWHVAGGAVFIATSGAWVGASRPWDGVDPGTLPDDGWAGTAWDTSGGNGGFGLFAGCVAGRSIRYVEGVPSAVSPGAAVRRTASCSGAEHVIGGGQSISGAVSGARTVASYPIDGPDGGTIPDDGWTVRVKNLSGTSRTVRAWAVCLG